MDTIIKFAVMAISLAFAIGSMLLIFGESGPAYDLVDTVKGLLTTADAAISSALG